MSAGSGPRSAQASEEVLRDCTFIVRGNVKQGRDIASDST